MARSFSRNQLPVRAASSLSLVRISKGRWKRRYSSSCHCSARLPGQTMRQRWRSPRAISSLMSSPAMIVLPAPGSSASRKRSGWRGQHRLVDRGDLVRQRIDERGVDREHGIEQMREADAVRLGDEAEEGAVAVEAPWPPCLDDLEAWLVVAVEQLVRDPAGRGPCRSARAPRSRTTGR